MNPTRASFVVLVPLVALVHSFGQYLARGMWWASALEAGEPAGPTFSLASAAALMGALVATMTGAVGGGPACLTLGLLASAAGELLIAMDWTSPGSVAAGVGRTLATVGGASCALRAFGPRQDSARMALLIATYAAANLASMAASPMGTLLHNGLGAKAVIGVGGGIELFAAFLSAPLLYLAVVRPPEGAGGGSLRPPLLALGAGAAVVGGAGAGALWVGADFSYASMSSEVLGSAWLMTLNPLGVLVASAVAGGVLVALAVGGRQAPPLLVGGVGLLLAGAMLLPAALPGERGSLVQAAIAFASGVGEPLLFAGIVASAAGGVHWRVAPAMVAAFTALQTLPQWLVEQASSLLGLPTLGGVAAGVCGVATMLVGVAFLIAAFPLTGVRASLEGEEEEEDLPSGGLDPYGFPESAGPGPAPRP